MQIVQMVIYLVAYILSFIIVQVVKVGSSGSNERNC